MKKLTFYIFSMAVMVVVVPLIIAKGCGIIDEKPGKPFEPTYKDIIIDVYIKKYNKVEKMELEEYLIGVIAAEMPAEFEPEALKAQSVAARTYAWSRVVGLYGDGKGHRGAAVCTDPAHCQAWISKEDALIKWGSEGKKWWDKISHAVKETRGIIITYDGKPINPVFHSNSGGRTENSEDVWQGSVPYLKSVFSEGEDTSPEYIKTINISCEDFISKLKEEWPDIELSDTDIIDDINILDYTAGGRIGGMKIGNIIMEGTDFRRIFVLCSANFIIKKNDEKNITITTYGYGHGVGMSQRGAQSQALKGTAYENILKYYYDGISLDRIDIF